MLTMRSMCGDFFTADTATLLFTALIPAVYELRTVSLICICDCCDTAYGFKITFLPS
jgi:hypothetical protein